MLKTASCILLFAMALGSPAKVAQRPQYLYVLAADARYVSINLATNRATAALRIAELRSIDRAYADSLGGRLLIQSSNPTDANQSSGQLAAITEMRGTPEPTLRFTHWIRGPARSSSLVWAKALNKDLLLVSWQNEHGGVSTMLYNAATLAVLHAVENFAVTATTCLGANGQAVYAVANNPRHEIKALNLKSFAITPSSYNLLGSAAAFYKAPVASDGCTVAFIEHTTGSTQGSSPATVYLYDV